MTDREKLIELLRHPFQMVCGDTAIGCRRMPTQPAEELADHLIANGVTIEKWIPVTERLPEKWQDVLTASKNGDIDIDYVCSSGAWLGDLEYTYNQVTHWMPLPEPPKEE